MGDPRPHPDRPAPLHPLTAQERRTVYAAALRIRKEDAELGDLLLGVADGKDELLAAVHDRLNILGRHEQADRLRRLLFPDTN